MDKLEQRIAAIMDAIPPDRRWLPWCDALPGPCACLGCINHEVAGKMTQAMWHAWFQKNDRRKRERRRR